MSAKKKQQERKEEDPNAIWGHALSLEDTRIWEDKRAELFFMKDLFDYKLPIGEKKDEIDEYFNRLEELIDTKDPSIQNDKFPDDFRDIDLHGEVLDPPKQFSYFSADLFEQQASTKQSRYESPTQSRLEFKSLPQNMETTTNVHEEQPVSDVSEKHGDLQCVGVSDDADDPDHWAGDLSNTSW
jgi:hypothetical protein